MNKHTPEPWCLSPSDPYFVSKVGGKGYVAKMMPLGAPRDRKGLPTDISDEMCANARRIVACVNACRGLPTEELEQKGIVAAVGTQLLDLDESLTQARAHASAYKDRYAKEASRTHDLEKLRDELLSALEGYMGAVSRMNQAMQDGFNVQGALSELIGYEHLAQAAITKAKGGAA